MSATTAAIIQSRTGSTRYPNKALAELGQIPLTEHIIKRIKAAGVFDTIVLAIPDKPEEEPLQKLGQANDIQVVAGPEDDVLQRFILAGETVGANHILRVCGDNPLIDISLMRTLKEEHFKHQADYTVVGEAIPLGTGTELAALESLKKIAEITRENRYREHVTTYFHDHPDDFRITRVKAPFYLRNMPLRLTVDTEDDLKLLRHLYDKFQDPYLPVNLEQVMFYLVNRPEIYGINAHVSQKDWRA